MSQQRNSPEPNATVNRVSFADLLERFGFRIRGVRADCAYCEGRSRLTVAIGSDVAYCHRCGWTANCRTLCRKLGIPVSSETTDHRERRSRAKEYNEWRDTCQQILSSQFRRMGRKAALAKVALTTYPEFEAAWCVLKKFYSNEAQLCGALDMLSYEKASCWLGQPMSIEKLFRAFEEGKACAARHN